MIHVVAGLLWEGDRFLMGLRKSDRKRPSLWEMPGGKVERSENPQGALEREWIEELGQRVVVHERIATAMFDWDDLVVVDLHIVLPWDTKDNVPKLIDHAELRWVTLDEALNNLPCSPAVYIHYPWIKRWQAK